MNFILCSIYDVVAKTSSDMQKFPNEASAIRATKEQMQKMPHPEDFQLVKNADVEIADTGYLVLKSCSNEILFVGSSLVSGDMQDNKEEMPF